MDITFCCDKCGQNLEVEEAGAGMTVDCPKCGKPVYVPSGPKATEPSEPRVPGKPKATEPIKPRIAGKQGSPHAQRAEEVIREMEDAQELAKFIENRIPVSS